MLDEDELERLARAKCWPSTRLCETEGCFRKHLASGLCSLHYSRSYRGSDGRGKRGPKFRDLAGERHGMLVAVEFIGIEKGLRIWRWKCDCGGERLSSKTALLRSGRSATPNCGCRQTEINRGNIKRAAESQVTHGMSGTPTYRSWQDMRKRCYKTYNSRYNRYGARGITVCDRWRDSFENFLEDMGIRPDPIDGVSYSISRLDHDGNYEPSNCEWALRYTH